MKIENADVDGMLDDVPRPDSAEGAQSVDIDVKSESDETATVSMTDGLKNSTLQTLFFFPLDYIQIYPMNLLSLQ